jgi:hypothetical protein
VTSLHSDIAGNFNCKRSLCRKAWLDLRPYLDTSPYVVFGQASIQVSVTLPIRVFVNQMFLFSYQRTYGMFRTLGLRHLCVINKYNQVVGIVTRADLVSTHTLLDEDGDEALRSAAGAYHEH